MTAGKGHQTVKRKRNIGTMLILAQGKEIVNVL